MSLKIFSVLFLAIVATDYAGSSPLYDDDMATRVLQEILPELLGKSTFNGWKIMSRASPWSPLTLKNKRTGTLVKVWANHGHAHSHSHSSSSYLAGSNNNPDLSWPEVQAASEIAQISQIPQLSQIPQVASKYEQWSENGLEYPPSDSNYDDFYDRRTKRVYRPTPQISSIRPRMGVEKPDEFIPFSGYSGDDKVGQNLASFFSVQKERTSPIYSIEKEYKFPLKYYQTKPIIYSPATQFFNKFRNENIPE